MLEALPALGICGWSGSGKTTVIEKIIGVLTARGLRVAVIKHDVHGLSIDREGKDSDRFFRAGADVLLHGPRQGCLRTHHTQDTDLHATLRRVCPQYDLVLVEGHKSTPLPCKVWLLSGPGDDCPGEDAIGPVRAVLGRNDDRVSAILAMIDAWLPEAWLRTPLCAGILTGPGRETPGARCLEHIASTVRAFARQTFVLADPGPVEVPDGIGVLPPAVDVPAALAGVLAAMRWRPLASWLFLPWDSRLVTERSIGWLLSTRAPGVWATMPRWRPESPEQWLPAHIDYRCARLLENASEPGELTESPRVIAPTPPQ